MTEKSNLHTGHKSILKAPGHVCMEITFSSFDNNSGPVQLMVERLRLNLMANSSNRHRLIKFPVRKTLWQTCMTIIHFGVLTRLNIDDIILT